ANTHAQASGDHLTSSGTTDLRVATHRTSNPPTSHDPTADSLRIRIMASYYCPTAILTDAQKAPTTFSLAVPALSHSPLNNNSGTPITPATTLDLPLWLAEMLAVSRPSGPASAPLATLDMPSALGPKVMNALTADATSVELRQQAQWFYGLGERMLELFEDEEMGAVLLNVSFLRIDRPYVRLLFLMLMGDGAQC
ncbi:DNA replication protein, partial [Friedmanniomyces endolithicus]